MCTYIVAARIYISKIARQSHIIINGFIYIYIYTHIIYIYTHIIYIYIFMNILMLSVRSETVPATLPANAPTKEALPVETAHQGEC